MEHEHLYPVHSLPHFLLIFCYLTLWDLGVPSPCVLWLAQHQLKGSATVINSHEYSCGFTSTVVCVNKCWIRRKSESNFCSKGSLLCFSVLCWQQRLQWDIKKKTSFTPSKQGCVPAMLQRWGFWCLSLIWSREVPRYCVLAGWRHRLCEDIESPLQLWRDRKCHFCTKMEQRTNGETDGKEKVIINTKSMVSHTLLQTDGGHCSAPFSVVQSWRLSKAGGSKERTAEMRCI